MPFSKYIIVSTIIALACKYFYNNSNKKEDIKIYLFIAYMYVASFVGFYTIKQSIIDIKKYFQFEYDSFNTKLLNIYRKLLI